MRYLLDTNICIYALNKRPPLVLEHIRNTDPADVCISVVTQLELRHGAEKSRYREKTHRKLDAFLGPLQILPLEQHDAEEAARIRAMLQMNGTPIGDYDCLIAGQARARKLTLVSNNLREFDRVDDLRTANWAIG